MFVSRPRIILEAEIVHIKIIGQRLKSFVADSMCSRKECVLALLLQKTLPKHLCSTVGILLRVTVSHELSS